MLDSLLKGLDGLFVTNPTNIRYLTGFTGVAPGERESFVLLTRDTTYLFSYALYRETAEALVRNCPVSVTGAPLTFVELNKERTITKALSHIASSLPLTRIGFEEKNITVYELRTMRDKVSEGDFIPTTDRIETSRKCKNPEELRNIQKATKLTDDCYIHIKNLLIPGVTESAIVTAIETYFRSHGAENAFAPIVAFGTNTALPHYGLSHVSVKPLRKNDLVLVDFGAKVEGYCADMTRMVFIGHPKPEWITAYSAVLGANEKALTMLANGERSGATVDAAAREIVAEANLPVYPHSLGHGVGMDVHESPRLTVFREETLKPGMVVTVEPGAYIAGSFGIRIEDLLLIQKDAIKILSHSPKEMLIRT